jgi:hypothetical protein
MLKRMLHRSGAALAAIDQMVTMDAPAYQITQDLQPLYHSTFVHNAVYVPDDPAVRPGVIAAMRQTSAFRHRSRLCAAGPTTSSRWALHSRGDRFRIHPRPTGRG